jgi:hypothetical protein
MKLMKRLHIALLIGTGLLTGMMAAQSDSLAEAARKHREQQAGKTPAAKVFTNDNLPTDGTISTVGAPVPAQPAADAASAAPKDGDSKDAAGKDSAGKDAAKPADESKTRQKTWEEWREKIQKQKAAADQLQKENEDLERQFKLTTGNYYNNAQQRVYDGAAMAKEDAAYKEQMEQKQKSLSDARQKVDDLQEQARRAGVPSGYRE